MRRISAFAVLVVLALIACKRGRGSSATGSETVTVSPVVDAGDVNVGAAYEAKLNPIFEAIEKTGHALPARIARGYLKLPAGAVLGDTAEYIHSDDMGMLTYPPTQFQTFRVGGSGVFLSCARVIKKKEPAVDDPKSKLERCAKTEYLIVVRTKKFDEPKSHNGLQFVSGKVDGDVLVYSLPSMKLLGGFPYTAESSKQVREGEIEKDMQQNWATAMKDGMRKLHPESKLAFAF